MPVYVSGIRMLRSLVWLVAVASLAWMALLPIWRVCKNRPRLVKQRQTKMTGQSVVVWRSRDSRCPRGAVRWLFLTPPCERGMQVIQPGHLFRGDRSAILRIRGIRALDLFCEPSGLALRGIR